jgi:hypothetical protein
MEQQFKNAGLPWEWKEVLEMQEFLPNQDGLIIRRMHGERTQFEKDKEYLSTDLGKLEKSLAELEENKRKLVHFKELYAEKERELSERMTLPGDARPIDRNNLILLMKIVDDTPTQGTSIMRRHTLAYETEEHVILDINDTEGMIVCSMKIEKRWLSQK